METTIYPSLPLTDFAKNHLNDLHFGNEPPLVEPKSTIKERKLNCFGRFIHKFHENESNAAGIGRLILFLALSLSIIGIPFVVVWFRERNNQLNSDKVHKVAIEKLNLESARINLRAKIIDKLNLEQKFGELPQLDLQGRMGATNYIDFLQPDDLKAPIMKGSDKFDRPFIALKVFSQEDPQPFVVVLFERFQDLDRWVWCSTHDKMCVFNTEVDGADIEDKTLKFFRSLIEGQHPKYKLVP